jgi:hypothetical protein
MRRATLAIGLALALAGISSAPAGAATLSPATANFGNQAVGSVSTSRAFTLTPDLLDLTLTIGTTGDFRQTNTCGPVLQIVSGPCTINVSFAPTAAGGRSGTLSTTSLILGGPSAQLAGTGTQGPDSNANQGAAKKCKKKKGKKKRGKKGVDTAVASKKKKKKGKKCKKRKKGKRKKK